MQTPNTLPRTALRYNEVRDEYDDFAKFAQTQGQTPISFEEFAKSSDELDQTPGLRAAGYNDNVLKQATGAFTGMFDPVAKHTEQLGSDAGAWLDKRMGWDGKAQGVLSEVGRDLPMDVAETLALTGATVLTGGGGAPGLIANTGSKLAKVGKLASTAMKGAAYASPGLRAYTDTDSVTQGLIASGGELLGDKLAEKGASYAMGKAQAKFGSEFAREGGAEELLAQARGKVYAPGVPSDPLKQRAEFGKVAGGMYADALQKGALPVRAAGMLGGSLGGIAAGEISHQVQGFYQDVQEGEIQGKNHNPFTVENILSQSVNAVISGTPMAAAHTFNKAKNINPLTAEQMPARIAKAATDAFREADAENVKAVIKGHADAWDAAATPEERLNIVKTTAASLTQLKKAQLDNERALGLKGEDPESTMQTFDAAITMTAKSAKYDPEQKYNIISHMGGRMLKHMRDANFQAAKEGAEYNVDGTVKLPYPGVDEAHIRQLVDKRFLDNSPLAHASLLREQEWRSLEANPDDADLEDSLVQRMAANYSLVLEDASKQFKQQVATQAAPDFPVYTDKGIRVKGTQGGDLRRQYEAELAEHQKQVERFLTAVGEMTGLPPVVAPVQFDESGKYQTTKQDRAAGRTTEPVDIAKALYQRFMDLSAMKVDEAEKHRSGFFAKDVADWWDSVRANKDNLDWKNTNPWDPTEESNLGSKHVYDHKYHMLDASGKVLKPFGLRDMLRHDNNKYETYNRPWLSDQFYDEKKRVDLPADTKQQLTPDGDMSEFQDTEFTTGMQQVLDKWFTPDEAEDTAATATLKSVDTSGDAGEARESIAAKVSSYTSKLSDLEMLSYMLKVMPAASPAKQKKIRDALTLALEWSRAENGELGKGRGRVDAEAHVKELAIKMGPTYASSIKKGDSENIAISKTLTNFFNDPKSPYGNPAKVMNTFMEMMVKDAMKGDPVRDNRGNLIITEPKAPQAMQSIRLEPAQRSTPRTAEDAVFPQEYGRGNINFLVKENKVGDYETAYNATYNYLRKVGHDEVTSHAFARIGTKAWNLAKHLDLNLMVRMEKEEYNRYFGKALQAFERLSTYMDAAGEYFDKDTWNGIYQDTVAIAADPAGRHASPKHRGYLAASTILHEVTHAMVFDAVRWQKMGAADLGEALNDRYNAAVAINELDQKLDPLTKYDIINTLGKAFFPHDGTRNDRWEATEMANFKASYGSGQHEFATVLSELVGMGMLASNRKKLDVGDVFKFSPDEVNMFAKGQFRDLYDNLNAITEAVKVSMAGQDPEFTKAFTGAMRASVENVAHMLDAINVTQKSRGHLSAIFDSMAHATQRPMNVGVFAVSGAGEESDNSPGRVMSKLFSIGQNNIPGLKKTGYQTNWYERNFVPFVQVMDKMRRAGNVLADDLMAATNVFRQSTNGLVATMMEPFLDQNTDGTAQLHAKNAIIQVQRDPKAREVVNALQTMQDNHKGQAFVPQNGTLVVNSQIQNHPAIAKWQRLDPQQRQAVANAMEAWYRVGQNAGEQIIAQRERSVASRVGLYVMRVTEQNGVPTEHSVAYSQGMEIFRQAQQGNVQQMHSIMGMLGLDPKQAASVEKLLLGARGVQKTSLTQRFLDMSDNLRSNQSYMSAQRGGRYIIYSKSLNSDNFSDGAEDRFDLEKKLKLIGDQGHYDITVVDKYEKENRDKFAMPERLMDAYGSLVDSAWDDFLGENPLGLPTATVDDLRKSFSPSAGAHAEQGARGMGKFLQERTGAPAALGLDYVDNMRHYVPSLAETISRRDLLDRSMMIMADSRANQEKDFRTVGRKHVEGMMTPNPQEWKLFKTGISAYYLAMNLSSMAVEGMQSLQTLVPVLVRQDNVPGFSVARAYKTMGRALKEVLSFSLDKKGMRKLVDEADRKLGLGMPLTREEATAHAYMSAHRAGELSHGAIQDQVFAGDQRAVMTKAFGHGSYGKPDPRTLAMDSAYLGMSGALKLYGMVSNFNQKIAFLAGFHQAMDQGMRPQDAYSQAVATKHISMATGGKANMPGYVHNFASESTQPAWATWHTLQQYGMSLVGHYQQNLSEGFLNNKSLPPKVRMQSKKALGVMLTTQVALSGLLGVPFVGATLTMLENLFGLDADKALREWFTTEDENGIHDSIASMAMTGVANHLTGLDLGSRLGLGGYMGTSYYNGFQAQDLLGPGAGVLEQLYKASKEFVSGDPIKGTYMLAPNGLKGGIELGINKAKYGDMGLRDRTGNLMYTPQGAEIPAYAVGFKPAVLSQRRDLARQEQQIEDRQRQQSSRQLQDRALRMHQGDPGLMNEMLDESLQSGDPSTYAPTVRGVADKAQAMFNPKDYTAGGTRKTAAAQEALLKTYPKEVVGQRPQFDQELDSALAAAEMGVRPSKEALVKAMLIDRLVEDQGITRAHAAQLLTAMGY
jgi:hypothetical protein